MQTRVTHSQTADHNTVISVSKIFHSANEDLLKYFVIQLFNNAVLSWVIL
jgi:hypothetical protein